LTYITFTDLPISKNVEISSHQSDKSYFAMVVMCCWIQFDENILIIFASMIIRDIGVVFFFVVFLFCGVLGYHICDGFTE
jgi:hypothetical protein